ncbi:hypothetical protein PGB90_003822 [Kerria lacca]
MNTFTISSFVIRNHEASKIFNLVVLSISVAGVVKSKNACSPIGITLNGLDGRAFVMTLTAASIVCIRAHLAYFSMSTKSLSEAEKLCPDNRNL